MKCTNPVVGRVLSRWWGRWCFCLQTRCDFLVKLKTRSRQTFLLRRHWLTTSDVPGRSRSSITSQSTRNRHQATCSLSSAAPSLHINCHHNSTLTAPPQPLPTPTHDLPRVDDLRPLPPRCHRRRARTGRSTRRSSETMNPKRRKSLRFQMSMFVGLGHVMVSFADCLPETSRYSKPTTPHPMPPPLSNSRNPSRTSKPP